VSKKILVTGAGGFIGYNLCIALADSGHEVIGVNRHYPKHVMDGPQQHFRAVTTDFRNWNLMNELLSGVEVVFHLASAHLQISLPDSEYWDVNVHSLKPLLELAEKCGVQRFVHASSVSVYGDLTEMPATEESPCNPQSIYGQTKLAGEKEVLSFAETTGFPVVITRPAWVYGPHCPRTLRLYKALRKGHFAMIGNGGNLRHPIFIADMIEAFRLTMEAQSAVGELFLIAGQAPISTKELVQSFCEVLDLPAIKIRIPYMVGAAMALGLEAIFWLARREPPISKRSLEFFKTNNAFNINKVSEVLGFQPQFSFKEGLRHIRQWLSENA
jgi:nucleoside-diphosphate-sugar epimerase